jgi:hypothetical protein
MGLCAVEHHRYRSLAVYRGKAREDFLISEASADQRPGFNQSLTNTCDAANKKRAPLGRPEKSTFDFTDTLGCDCQLTPRQLLLSNGGFAPVITE